MTEQTPPPGTDDPRTRWSEDRTLMAAERTFNAALRTALGCVGVALGLHAVFRSVAPGWAPKAVALLFLALALLLVWSSRHRLIDTHRRLRDHDIETEGARLITLISIAVTAGVAGIGAILLT